MPQNKVWLFLASCTVVRVGKKLTDCMSFLLKDDFASEKKRKESKQAVLRSTQTIVPQLFLCSPGLSTFIQVSIVTCF